MTAVGGGTWLGCSDRSRLSLFGRRSPTFVACCWSPRRLRSSLSWLSWALRALGVWEVVNVLPSGNFQTLCFLLRSKMAPCSLSSLATSSSAAIFISERRSLRKVPLDRAPLWALPNYPPLGSALIYGYLHHLPDFAPIRQIPHDWQSRPPAAVILP